MAKEKFIIEPHFRLQEWVADEKGYFKDEGLDYIFQELVKSTDGAHHYKGDKVGAMQSFERGRSSDVSCACHWTVGVAASKGKGKLYADVYSVAPSGVFVPQDSPIKRPEDLAGVPIAVGYQSGSHYSTIQALEQYMPADKINLQLRRRHAVPPARPIDRRQGAGLGAVQRALLLRRATRLPQDHRHDLHDRDHGHRRSRSGRPAQVLPRAASARSATSICGPISTPTTTRTNSPRAITPRWTRAAGGRASGWCSSPTPRRSTRRPSSGSPITASSPTPAWARATTRKRSSARTQYLRIRAFPSARARSCGASRCACKCRHRFTKTMAHARAAATDGSRRASGRALARAFSASFSQRRPKFRRSSATSGELASLARRAHSAA